MSLRSVWLGTACLGISFVGGMAGSLFVQSGKQAYAGSLPAQAGKEVFKEVYASKFALVDKAGKVHGLMVADEEGYPTFSMLDEQNRVRLGMGILKDGPFFTLVDATESNRISMNLSEKDELASISLRKKEGAAAAMSLIKGKGLLTVNGKPVDR